MAGSGPHTERLIIVVATRAVGAANDAVVSVLGETAGRETFTVGLVPAPGPPGAARTAFWASLTLRPAGATALADALQFLVDAGTCVIYPGVRGRGEVDPQRYTPDEVLTAQGLQRYVPPSRLPQGAPEAQGAVDEALA